jgi:hypothetical protein
MTKHHVILRVVNQTFRQYMYGDTLLNINFAVATLIEYKSAREVGTPSQNTELSCHDSRSDIEAGFNVHIHPVESKSMACTILSTLRPLASHWDPTILGFRDGWAQTGQSTVSPRGK